MAFGGSHRLDFETCRAVLALQRPVILHRQRIGGERLHLYLAANSVRPVDPSDTDAIRHGALSRLGHQLAGAPPAGAAAAAAAALAASSARALRSLRGTARFGLLRCSRFMTPAASRKRSTRSVGKAPLASQALTFSTSSRTRSVFSFGNSGLKYPSRSMKRPSRGERLSAMTM